MWAAKWPPCSNVDQCTMFAWSRSAKRRMPLKSPPNAASPIGIVVGPVGWGRVGVLVVEPRRGGGGPRQPVEHDVREHEVGVEVLAEELRVPREQPDRGVAEREGQRLRLLGHERLKENLFS